MFEPLQKCICLHPTTRMIDAIVPGGAFSIIFTFLGALTWGKKVKGAHIYQRHLYKFRLLLFFVVQLMLEFQFVFYPSLQLLLTLFLVLLKFLSRDIYYSELYYFHLCFLSIVQKIYSQRVG